MHLKDLRSLLGVSDDGMVFSSVMMRNFYQGDSVRRFKAAGLSKIQVADK